MIPTDSIQNKPLRTFLSALFALFLGQISVAQEFTIEQTLSDQAQLTTLAFDGLSFITGSLGADSFFPPGKVADFWGFQYLRDNDPTDMGHNTGFLTKAAYNMLNVLTPAQRVQLVSLANRQVNLINQYAYDRFVLMKAFRRLLENDLPAGTNSLNRAAVKTFSADLYKLDGQISYQRARVMGSLLYQLTAEQKAYLDAMVGKGMLEWPEVTEPADMRGLEHDVKVAVMTYAGDMFSWYAGSVEADVYFCPERQGTYFGSFYMKDAPAVGNPDYTIDPNLTADYGNYFLQTLTPSEAVLITSLVDIQRPYLYEIVDRREDVSVLLRKFIAGETPDSMQVISLMGRYGELDGEIIWLYASRFATVNGMINTRQKDHLAALRLEVLGDFTPAGAFLYASPIPIPDIPDTDFLFEALDPDPLTFTGNELLGRPTTQSVTVNACATKELEVYVEYGTDSLNYVLQTEIQLCPDSIPFEFELTDLTADTRYFYRMRYRETGAAIFLARPSHSFHSARSSGQSFSFAVEADPHLDSNSSPAAFSLTLENILSGNPDFLLDLGDTFMSEKLTTGTQEEIVNRHLLMRTYFDQTGHSVPLFLVPGNHEGELGWMLNGTADNMPVYATNARKLYYPNPVPDSFYSGNSKPENFVGLRENYYSWEWGDALFVVIDPYWYTTKKPGWGWTLGSDQYTWFKNILSSSQAKFKFVFCHQLVGGNGTDGRGGTEYAHLYEMGGNNPDGTWGFDTYRPGWGKPIQTLMEENNVSVFFHGHDHFYGKQELDGVIYQEVPQPSAKNITNNQAEEYGYVNGTFLPGRGYLQISVNADQASVAFVKTLLPEEENASQQNGDIAHSYTIPAKKPATVSISTPATDIYAGETVTFSALTGNAGPEPAFQWKINGTPVGTNTNTLTCTPSDHDVVTCKLKTSEGYVAVSGEITMNVISVSKTEVLSRPTDKSVTINALFDQTCEVVFQYGLSEGTYGSTSGVLTAQAGESLVYQFGNLQFGTRYYYRTGYRRPGTTGFLFGEEHSFVTQRPKGSTFRFTVMSDSHLYDKKGIPSVMRIAMANQMDDQPDFVLDMGDTFGDDRNPTAITREVMDKLHANFLPYIGIIGHSVPFFFCMGNHEGENGYYLNQASPENIGVYGSLARKKYYSNPYPDGFFSGNTDVEENGIGQPENYYAWEWGDALLVVLDAYRYSTVNAKPRGWDWTLGKKQYDWFKQTLESSTAKYKFVFIHHILGETRGGVAVANTFEWGGYQSDGVTWGFTNNRPGWEMPIHQLMVQNKVNVLFQGHDHLFARETLDCVTYQEVPMPSDSTYTLGMLANGSAYTGDKFPGTGHLRITVGPESATVDFVRAYLPKDTLGTVKNGEVAFSYVVAPNGIPSVSVVTGSTRVCAGESVTFTANITNGGPSPLLQWKVNGTNTGSNSPVFSYVPTDQDVVTCEMTPSGACTAGNPVVSNPVTLSVFPVLPLGVTIRTGSGTVCEGNAVSFTAEVSNGGDNPSYQWKVNNVPSGTNSSTFSYFPSDEDNVTCEVTVAETCISGNPATSNSVRIMVIQKLPVSVVISADSNPVCQGSMVHFQANVTNGGTSPAFQWMVNGVTAGNGSTFSYIPADLDEIQCLVTSDLPCTTGSPALSGKLVMAVIPLPQQPGAISGNTSLCAFSSGNVYGIALVQGALSYSWSVPPGAVITSGQGTLSVKVDFGASGGNISVAAVNSCGPGTSTSLAVSVNPGITATITPQGSTTFCQGGSVTLRATSGTGYLYQWKLNGTDISGATKSFYSAAATGNYTVLITKSGSCPGISTPVTVTVNPLPVPVITGLGPTTFCQGGTVVLASNTEPGLTYQWRKDGKSISGAVSSNLTVTASGYYSVQETSSYGCSAVSSEVKVTVNSVSPVSVTPTGPITLAAGGSTSLTATRLTGYNYQWYNNGVPVSGATSYKLTVTSSGYYKVKATNSSGGCSSESNTVMVNIGGTLKSSGLETAEIPYVNCYPNPVNDVVHFDYYLAEAGEVSLRIYDFSGKEVSVLLNQYQERGEYSVSYNLNYLVSGIYMYGFRAANHHNTFDRNGKIILKR